MTMQDINFIKCIRCRPAILASSFNVRVVEPWLTSFFTLPRTRPLKHESISSDCTTLVASEFWSCKHPGSGRLTSVTPFSSDHRPRSPAFFAGVLEDKRDSQQGEKKQRSSTMKENFIAGASASFLSKLVLQPFDTTKTILQVCRFDS